MGCTGMAAKHQAMASVGAAMCTTPRDSLSAMGRRARARGVLAFETGGFDSVQALVQEGLDKEGDPDIVLNEGVIPGMRAVGSQCRC